jgi:hypothetical protein
MPDLKVEIVVGFGRHRIFLTREIFGDHDYFGSFGASEVTSFSKRGSPRSGSQ